MTTAVHPHTGEPAPDGHEWRWVPAEELDGPGALEICVLRETR